MVDFKIDTTIGKTPFIEVNGVEIGNTIDKLILIMEVGCDPQLWVRHVLVNGQVEGDAIVTELPPTKSDPTPKGRLEDGTII